MYLTLQTLLFERLNVIPGQFLGFAIIYYISVVCARLLCIWEKQIDRMFIHTVWKIQIFINN